MDIDTSKPNSGRIYDYLLGGHHNFEADRQAAAKLVEFAPTLPRWMRLNRWFLSQAVDQIVAAGFRNYLDLATGLPSQGYLHERVPADSRIIYNDIDPATVNYAQQIIGDRPNIRYIQSDLRQPTQVLNEAEKFFGGDHLVGICMVGVAYFIDDAALSSTLHQLYDWAAPGSRLALSVVTVEAIPPDDHPALQLYKQIGTPLYPRVKEQVLQLASPWQPLGEGLRPLEAYAQDQTGATIQVERVSTGESMAGAIFEKPRA